MEYCPICNSKLKETKLRKITVYYCERCDVEGIEDVFLTLLNRKKSKFDEILENSFCWSDVVYKNYPKIICDLYEKSKSIISTKNIHSSVIIIKDILEVSLKLPVILSVHQIWIKNGNYEEYEKNILRKFLSGPLSLGSWVSLARDIVSNSPNNILTKITKSILKHIYNKNSINITYIVDGREQKSKLSGVVNWRNKRIGHGALFNHNDPIVMSEIEKILLFIKKHYDDAEKYYNQIDFFLEENIYYSIMDGDKISLSPFAMFISETQTRYFFDAYEGKKETISMLDYINGTNIEDEQHGKAIATKMAELKFCFDSYYVDDVILADARDFLENNLSLKNKEIIVPHYLDDWVKDILEDYEKGVFLLQMERGMGKSTFLRMYDQLGMNLLEDEDIAVQLFSINNIYAYKLSMFLNDLHFKLSSSRDKSLYSHTIETISSVTSTAKDFAYYLNMFYKKVYSVRGIEKLIIIIDGLDEIPESSQKTIYDIIPHESDLADGIYLMLSARVDEEVSHSDFYKEKMEQLKNNLSEKENVVYRDDVNNISLLHNFVQDKIKLGRKETDNIIKKSDYRMLYLKPLLDILGIKGVDDLEFNNSEMLFSKYIKMIYKIFSVDVNSMAITYPKKIEKLFITLVAANGTLNIYEIAHLYNWNNIDFELLGLLSDIKGFLKIDRSQTGNTYELHQQWADVLKKRYKNDIHKKQNEWIDNIISNKNYINNVNNIIISFSKTEEQGFIFLLLKISSYMNQSNNSIITNELLEILILFSKILSRDEKHDIFTRNRIINGIKSILENQFINIDINNEIILNSLVAENYKVMGINKDSNCYYKKTTKLLIQNNHNISLEKHCTILFDYGDVLEDLHENKKAIVVLESALNKIDASDFDNLELHIRILNRLGVAYGRINQSYLRTEIHNKAIKMLEAIPNENNESSNSLGMLYSNTGVYLMGKKKFYDSFIMLEKSYKIRKNLYEVKKFKKAKYGYSFTLNNIGSYYFYMKNYDESFFYFNQSYDLRKSVVYDDKRMSLLYRTATICNNLAISCEFLEKFNLGKEYYEKSISVFEKLVYKDMKIELLDYLGVVYNNFSLYYLNINDGTAYRELSKKSYGIFRTLIKNDDPTYREVWNKWFVQVCNNYTITQFKFGNTDIALHIIKQAISMINKLIYDMGHYELQDLLAFMLNNLSIVYYKKNQYIDAKTTLSKALDIIEKLMNDAQRDELKDEYDIITNNLESLNLKKNNDQLEFMKMYILL